MSRTNWVARSGDDLRGPWTPGSRCPFRVTPGPWPPETPRLRVGPMKSDQPCADGGAVPSLAASSTVLTGIALTAAGYALFASAGRVGQMAGPRPMRSSQMLFMRSIVIVGIVFAMERATQPRQFRPEPQQGGAGGAGRADPGRLVVLLFGRAAARPRGTDYVLFRGTDHRRIAVGAPAQGAGRRGPLDGRADRLRRRRRGGRADRGGRHRACRVRSSWGAACWGSSVVLVRYINRSDTTATQMLVSNRALHPCLSRPCCPGCGRTPDLEEFRPDDGARLHGRPRPVPDLRGVPLRAGLGGGADRIYRACVGLSVRLRDLGPCAAAARVRRRRLSSFSAA